MVIPFPSAKSIVPTRFIIRFFLKKFEKITLNNVTKHHKIQLFYRKFMTAILLKIKPRANFCLVNRGKGKRAISLVQDLRTQNRETRFLCVSLILNKCRQSHLMHF
jgi:hypothetical protein